MIAEIYHNIIRELTCQVETSFVMRSQLTSLSKQLPFLYFTLCFGASLLSLTHYEVAPKFLTLIIPFVVVPACILRMKAWRRIVVRDLSDLQVQHYLRLNVMLTGLLGLGFTAWLHILFNYGDDLLKGHVLFFIGITSIGCIFCLVHVRPAALLIIGIVMGSFFVRFVLSGEFVLTALAINLLAASVLLIFVLLSYYQDFRRLVQSTVQLSALGEEHRRAAQLDSLTGLANRRRFFQDLALTVQDADRLQRPFALGLVDLDGFKPINDMYGHGTGDHVLKEIGRRLECLSGTAFLIARLGGDEFGLIVPPGLRQADLAEIGLRICRELATPIEIGPISVAVTASVGFAVYPDMGHSEEQLVERADFALYHAKDHRRGTAVVFTEQHATEIGDRRRLEHELRHADLEAELWIAFQPIVDVGNGRIASFEALARWSSPALGAVSPGAFVPAAERLGIVSELTNVLFRKAARAACAWPEDVRLSFNLSVDDLIDDSQSSRLLETVAGCGLCPKRVILEITETAIMRDFGRANTTLQALRGLGCLIALDDFGTGFSSLSYVNRLPLDKLKIDQSFVRSVLCDRTSRTIIESIRGLSENLEIDCVVEGVETGEQVAILREIGCTKMQGYFFGRPMPADAVLGRLSAPALPPLPAPVPAPASVELAAA